MRTKVHLLCICLFLAGCAPTPDKVRSSFLESKHVYEEIVSLLASAPVLKTVYASNSVFDNVTPRLTAIANKKTYDEVASALESLGAAKVYINRFEDSVEINYVMIDYGINIFTKGILPSIVYSSSDTQRLYGGANKCDRLQTYWFYCTKVNN